MPLYKFSRRQILGLFGLIALVGFLAGIVFPADAFAAIKSKQKYCYSAQDGGYRVLVSVQYNELLPYETITIVSNYGQHRVLGVWKDDDWVSSLTNDMVVSGNTVQIKTVNPGQTYRWNPVQHGYKTGYLSLKTAASGGGKSFSGCTITF